jgi:hypothetical protein
MKIVQITVSPSTDDHDRVLTVLTDSGRVFETHANRTVKMGEAWWEVPLPAHCEAELRENLELGIE